MASEEELSLFNEIIERGCCRRCALRYMGVCREMIMFDHPTTTLVNFGLLSPMEEFNLAPPNKKKKANPCTVCLGLLEDEFLQEVLECADLSKESEYQNETYEIYITFSKCILIRDHSMQLHLKHKFPEIMKIGNGSEIKINKAWQLSIEKKMTKLLKRTHQHAATLRLHFYSQYQLEKEELEQFSKGFDSFSKHQLVSILKTISDEEFRKLVTVPPKPPFYGVTFKNVVFSTESIHLTGSYLKYSRDLYQTTIESSHSIQSYILNAIKSVAGNCKEMKFQTSGYEEKNVRLLSPRTFSVDLIEPRFETVSPEQCKKIEKIVNEDKGFKVMNLRKELRRDILITLSTEQIAPRTLKLLCLVENCKNIDRGINAVNMYRKLTVRQKTPIRVIHQRFCSKKSVTIPYIKAKRKKDNIIEVDLFMDCGIQIPEFVNGDLGRTSPSLSEIMNAKVHLLAMDIVDFGTAAAPEDENDVVI